MPSTYNTFCDPSVGQTLRSDGTGADYGSIFGNCAAILGGAPALSPTNVNCADFSVIVMGDCNHINTFGSPASNGCFNFIGNGFCNEAAGVNNFIGGGGSNLIGTTLTSGNVEYSFIGSGLCNTICDNGSTAVSVGFIGGGAHNQLWGDHSAIVGGCMNVLKGTSSFIGGGEANNINANNNDSFIGGGALNCIDSGLIITPTKTIGGGYGNKICANCGYNSIFGGFSNVADGNYSFIGGGLYNSSLADGSAVAGGGCNNAGGLYSFIGGGGGATTGLGNTANGDCSFIGGGSANAIQNSSTFGVIGGGSQNTVCALTNYSSIFSGFNNCVLGNCSAILGGEGNNDGGLNYVGIFGCNVTGAMAQAFHVNELFIQNIPVALSAISIVYTSLPIGALYTTVASPSGWATRPVYIK